MPYRARVAAGLVLAATSYPFVARGDPASSPAPADDDSLDVSASSGARSTAPVPSVSGAPGTGAAAPAARGASLPALVPVALPSVPAVGEVGVSSPPPSSNASDRASAQEREIAELRARLASLEIKAAQEPGRPAVAADPPALGATSFDGSPWSPIWRRGFLISGYVQGQYQQSQLSENQLDANGAPLNQNRFLVRRARVRFDRGWQWAFATIEVDGNNENGLAFGLRRAEASLLWRAPEPEAPPRLVFSTGLTEIPFGYELYEPNRTRLFLERTTASRAFFPGDADFGAQITGAVGFFRYALAVMDGTPVPDSAPTIAGFDPTSQKDLMGRFGVETAPAPVLGLSGGVSFDRGTGYHAGSTATQDSLQWRDTNNNGVVDSGEIIGLPAQAAQPSTTYGRWMLGVDAELRLSSPLGRGILYGEAYVASNSDRNLFVPDPATTGVNLREIGWYVAFAQEIFQYGLLGFRVDAYNPSADATRQIGGTVLPLDQTITTFSPLVGAILPNRGRLVFEYDHVLNHEGLDSLGVPTDLRDDQWALRLQVEM